VRRCLIALAAMVALLLALPLHADTLNLTLDASTAGGVMCSDCGPFGAITVTQVTANSVLVTETLASGVGFVNTPAGNSLQFNIQGQPQITISNLTAGFSQAAPVGNSGAVSGFMYAIDCTSQAVCGKGGNNPYYGMLSFVVTSTTPLSAGAFGLATGNGYYASSDLIFPGLTGNIEAAKPGTLPPEALAATPEPAAMLLFGTGMVAFAGLLRKRLRKYV